LSEVRKGKVWLIVEGCMEQKGRRSESNRELAVGFWHLCSMMDEMHGFAARAH
jgi:hypothetical protein